MAKILTIVLVILIFRFIIKYVVPIFQMTRVARSKLNQMAQQMEDMQRKQQQKQQASQQSIDGEYIDYEEVK